LAARVRAQAQVRTHCYPCARVRTLSHPLVLVTGGSSSSDTTTTTTTATEKKKQQLMLILAEAQAKQRKAPGDPNLQKIVDDYMKELAHMEQQEKQQQQQQQQQQQSGPPAPAGSDHAAPGADRVPNPGGSGGPVPSGGDGVSDRRRGKQRAATKNVTYTVDDIEDDDDGDTDDDETRQRQKADTVIDDNKEETWSENLPPPRAAVPWPACYQECVLLPPPVTPRLATSHPKLPSLRSTTAPLGVEEKELTRSSVLPSAPLPRSAAPWTDPWVHALVGLQYSATGAAGRERASVGIFQSAASLLVQLLLDEQEAQGKEEQVLTWARQLLMDAAAWADETDVAVHRSATQVIPPALIDGIIRRIHALQAGGTIVLPLCYRSPDYLQVPRRGRSSGSENASKGGYTEHRRGMQRALQALSRAKHRQAKLGRKRTASEEADSIISDLTEEVRWGCYSLVLTRRGEGEQFNVAIVSGGGEGLVYHPCCCLPDEECVQYQPIVLTCVARTKLTDPAFWTVLLRHVRTHPANSARVLYEAVLPFLVDHQPLNCTNNIKGAAAAALPSDDNDDWLAPYAHAHATPSPPSSRIYALLSTLRMLLRIGGYSALKVRRLVHSLYYRLLQNMESRLQVELSTDAGGAVSAGHSQLVRDLCSELSLEGYRLHEKEPAAGAGQVPLPQLVSTIRVVLGLLRRTHCPVQRTIQAQRPRIPATAILRSHGVDTIHLPSDILGHSPPPVSKVTVPTHMEMSAQIATCCAEMSSNRTADTHPTDLRGRARIAEHALFNTLRLCSTLRIAANFDEPVSETAPTHVVALRQLSAGRIMTAIESLVERHLMPLSETELSHNMPQWGLLCTADAHLSDSSVSTPLEVQQRILRGLYDLLTHYVSASLCFAQYDIIPAASGDHDFMRMTAHIEGVRCVIALAIYANFDSCIRHCVQDGSVVSKELQAFAAKARAAGDAVLFVGVSLFGTPAHKITSDIVLSARHTQLRAQALAYFEPLTRVPGARVATSVQERPRALWDSFISAGPACAFALQLEEEVRKRKIFGDESAIAAAWRANQNIVDRFTLPGRKEEVTAAWLEAMLRKAGLLWNRRIEGIHCDYLGGAGDKTAGGMATLINGGLLLHVQIAYSDVADGSGTKNKTKEEPPASLVLKYSAHQSYFEGGQGEAGMSSVYARSKSLANMSTLNECAAYTLFNDNVGDGRPALSTATCYFAVHECTRGGVFDATLPGVRSTFVAKVVEVENSCRAWIALEDLSDHNGSGRYLKNEGIKMFEKAAKGLLPPEFPAAAARALGHLHNAFFNQVVPPAEKLSPSCCEPLASRSFVYSSLVSGLQRH
jgi:hypothetical protein